VNLTIIPDKPERSEIIMQTREFILGRLASYSKIHNDMGLHNFIKSKDRRTAIKDRRRCFTYIARDRRNGIADRRKKTPTIGAWISYWRKRKNYE
jgi:hypothetical protein